MTDKNSNCVICDCGSKLTSKYIYNRHLKTQKHLRWVSKGSQLSFLETKIKVERAMKRIWRKKGLIPKLPPSQTYTPEYYVKYKECFQRARAKYRKKNRNKINAYSLNFYHNLNPERKEKVRARMKEYNKRKTWKRRFSKVLVELLQTRSRYD